MKNKRRDLALVTAELQTVLKREAADYIAIGRLLTEAKEMLGQHGEWLPWLEANFGSSAPTAENYMNAARLAAKFLTVKNLKLRPTALYLLGRHLDDGPDALFSPKAIEAILKAAKSEWVNDRRAYDIAGELQPPPETEEQEEEHEDEAEQEQEEEEERRAAEAKKKAEDVLAGPPPELPPPSEAAAPDVNLTQFDRAVEALAQIYTKSLDSFIDTTHTQDKITAIADFLQKVAELIAKQKAA
jgi:hypothetical protein